LLTSVLDGNELEDRHLTLPCRLVLRDSCAINNSRTTASKLAG
jgi:hypothetical protein